jgi:predicted metal-dependent hydrolase
VNNAAKPARSVVLLGGRVSYTIERTRTGRRCRIRVSPAGVVVVLPRDTDEARAASFLRENARWVLEQIDCARRRGRVGTPRDSADSLLLRGKNVAIEIIEAPSRRRYAVVAQCDGVVRVRIPEGRSVDPRKAVENWLRRQARHDLLARIATRAAELKVQPGRVYVMDQKTKWGNCSRLRNLSFNWRLVKAPPAVLDYVVVHELAHLLEPSHSARFWLVVRSCCPHYAQHRRWLKDHQTTLTSRPTAANK